jgi:hypothetical protein
MSPVSTAYLNKWFRVFGFLYLYSRYGNRDRIVEKIKLVTDYKTPTKMHGKQWERLSQFHCYHQCWLTFSKSLSMMGVKFPHQWNNGVGWPDLRKIITGLTP